MHPKKVPWPKKRTYHLGNKRKPEMAVECCRSKKGENKIQAITCHFVLWAILLPLFSSLIVTIFAFKNMSTEKMQIRQLQ